MTATALLLALLQLPIAADVETTASQSQPPAQINEAGLTGSALNPITLASGPPSGGAVTFEVDWRLISQPIDVFGLSFDFIVQMHTDVVRLLGLDASRSIWEWSFLDFEGAVIDDAGGTVIDLVSTPAVNAVAWEFGP